MFNNIAALPGFEHLPHKRDRRFQMLHSFRPAFIVSNNVGNLLFAQS